MIPKEKLQRVIILCIIFVPGTIVSILIITPSSAHPVTDLSLDISRPHGSSMNIHKAKLDCAGCHLDPIVVNSTDCMNCHATKETPPTTLKPMVNFPHHDPAPGGPMDDCLSCHNANNDARDIEEPKAVMHSEPSFCNDTCHASLVDPPTCTDCHSIHGP